MRASPVNTYENWSPFSQLLQPWLYVPPVIIGGTCLCLLEFTTMLSVFWVIKVLMASSSLYACVYIYVCHMIIFEILDMESSFLLRRYIHFPKVQVRFVYQGLNLKLLSRQQKTRHTYKSTCHVDLERTDLRTNSALLPCCFMSVCLPSHSRMSRSRSCYSNVKLQTGLSFERHDGIQSKLKLLLHLQTWPRSWSISRTRLP